MRVLRFGAGLAAGAAALWLLAGRGLVNYDSLYVVLWGREIASGRRPTLDVPVAPTLHPLTEAGAVLLAPLGAGVAIDVVLALGFIGLAVLGWVVFALGRAWFGAWAGAASALIVVTRVPVLDYGARAYLDIPFLALVLGALLVETRRPRAGAPVLWLLVPAGLLRPEAWLFSAAYVGWLAWTGERRRLARVVAVAAVAPVLWVLHDLVLTGNPLYSLTDTRASARELGRVTGLVNVPTAMPRRIGEILREPGLLAAAGGGLLALAWRRRERGVRLGAVAGVVAVVAFSILASAGLPIRTRYLMLVAAILALFAGAGLFGWEGLPRGPRRTWWARFSLLAIVVFAAFAPLQAQRIGSLRDALRIQDAIEDDLGRVVARAPCAPYVVPNRRPVPLVALWRDVSPADVVDAQQGLPATGTYFVPRTAEVARDYILDPSDLDRRVPAPPAGWRELPGNASWRVAVGPGCAAGARAR